MPVLNICLSYVLNFILAVFQRVVESIAGYNKSRRCHISLSFSTDTLPNRGSNYMYLIIICIYQVLTAVCWWKESTDIFFLYSRINRIFILFLILFSYYRNIVHSSAENSFNGTSFPGITDALYKLQDSPGDPDLILELRHHFSVVVFTIQSAAYSLRNTTTFLRKTNDEL